MLPVLWAHLRLQPVCNMLELLTLPHFHCSSSIQISSPERPFPDHPASLWLSRNLPCFIFLYGVNIVLSISYESMCCCVSCFLIVWPPSPLCPANTKSHVFLSCCYCIPRPGTVVEWLDGRVSRWRNEWMPEEWAVCHWDGASGGRTVDFPSLWDYILCLCIFRRVVDGLLLSGRKQ